MSSGFDTSDLENALYQLEKAVAAQTSKIDETNALLRALIGTLEENSQAISDAAEQWRNSPRPRRPARS